MFNIVALLFSPVDQVKKLNIFVCIDYPFRPKNYVESANRDFILFLASFVDI